MKHVARSLFAVPFFVVACMEPSAVEATTVAESELVAPTPRCANLAVTLDEVLVEPFIKDIRRTFVDPSFFPTNSSDDFAILGALRFDAATRDLVLAGDAKVARSSPDYYPLGAEPRLELVIDGQGTDLTPGNPASNAVAKKIFDAMLRSGEVTMQQPGPTGPIQTVTKTPRERSFYCQQRFVAGADRGYKCVFKLGDIERFNVVHASPVCP